MSIDPQTVADDNARAVINALIAETAKINAEARWFPFIATAGLFAAAAGLVKLLGI